MIIDDNRKTACVHVKDGENYLRYLTDDEFSVLQKTESYEDEYTDMWKTFFHSISIEQRKNYVCQRNLFPIWKRKQPWNSDNSRCHDRSVSTHKKTETTPPVFFIISYFITHGNFALTTQVKHGDFPFSIQNGLRTKEAACRTE